MDTAILPAPAWFRWKFSCRRVEALPGPAEGRLCPLENSDRLPTPSALGGEEVWWDLRAGWNPAGLGFALEVHSKRPPIVGEADFPEMSDGIEIWIDTRDTRDVHRATRHCHRYLARVAAAPQRGPLVVAIEQRKIHRAQEDAKIQRQPDVRTRIGRLKDGWWLDLFFPATSLSGYDPETNPRLGFGYSLHDPIRGDRFLTLGRDFPIGEDPSLWSTLELAGATARPAEADPAKTRKKKSRA